MKHSDRPLLHRLFPLIALICGLAIGGCEMEPPPFNPNQLQRTARARADENPTQGMRPLPTRLETPFLPAATQPATRPSFSAATRPSPTTRPIRRLSLREIVRTVVAHNADAHVASYQPAIDQNRVIEAAAAYDLKYFSTFQYASQNVLQPSASNPLIDPFGSNATVFRDLTIQNGLRQQTTTGAKVELRYDINQFDRRGPGARGLSNNPFWNNDITLQITQPLLQNFGAAANTARIAIARNTQKVSMLDFRLSLEKNLAEVEQEYWQLVQAEQDVKIREELLSRTEATVDLLHKRIGTKGTTNTEVAQGNAALRQREAEIIRARSQVVHFSDQIKQHMNDPDFPVASGDLILPADVPIDAPIQMDPAEQIRVGLTYRAELSQQQVKIDSAQITIGAAKNNLLPSLNLILSTAAQGVGTEFGPTVGDQARFGHIDYTVGFQLEVPIGNREARAIYQRTLLQRLQAIEQYRALIDQVTFEINDAVRELNTTWEEMAATRQARIAAEEPVKYFLQRENVGEQDMTPSYIQTKLDQQSNLSEAQRREITAITNYNIALSTLERAKGTLLRYDNVELEEEVRPYAVKPLGK